MTNGSPPERAYFAPFAVFLGFIALNQFVAGLSEGTLGVWWWTEPHFWIFPLQTFVCGGLILRYWRHYELTRPAGVLFAIFIGVAVFFLWVAPHPPFIDRLLARFGIKGHPGGFDPTYFGNSGWAFWLTVSLRFLRLVVVVPLVEEIFWRGYLLRMLIAEPFSSARIGTFSWRSFSIVTVGFCLIHHPADWPAAIITGVLFNAVAYRTHSLSACVLTHAVANLVLGLYIMRTGQWGFW